MDYRDCSPRFPLLPGQPDRLLAELHEAQTALAIVDHYMSCRNVYPFTGNAPPSRWRSYAAHDALREACGIIDRLVEELRIQVAAIPFEPDDKMQDE
jgi:hypothetical protein